MYVYVCWCDCVVFKASKSEMYNFYFLNLIYTRQNKNSNLKKKIIQTGLNNR